MKKMSAASMIARVVTCALTCVGTSWATGAGAKPFMIVGNDEKVVWDADGKGVLSPPGKDSVLLVDLADPESPKIVATLPLKNSVVGPPTNLAIDPTGGVALVADSVNIVDDNGTLKQVPDDKIHVIDLRATPPKLAATITGGKQPSGLDINPKGDMALVANRGDNSVSVFSIHGTDVKLVDTIAMGDTVAHVAFTPDGRHALAAKSNANKIAWLDIGADGKVTYGKYDMLGSPFPYNIAAVPGGHIALTSDNGNNGASDGQVDTASVIDIEQNPPRIIDKVVVGDGPEGLAVSPRGDLAVSVILRGSNAARSAFFYNKTGAVDVLKIDGKKVTKIKTVEVGALPEAAVFTPDGKYILVGNYLDMDFSILRVDGTDVTDTGKRFKVPGHPASARMGPM